jgi:glutathione synthase/RimK-type ligase-like ATP-grasp enzyme
MKIARIRPRAVGRMDEGAAAFFRSALDAHTRRDWKSPKAREIAKYGLAVLCDGKETLPPSSQSTIRHFARIAERLSVDVEPIAKKQLHQLAEFDGLFIRETTSIDNHTYRFARRAVHEGMPVIDDPVSMIRCTNKIYLMELLEANRVPMPQSVMLTDERDLDRAADTLGFPMVVKIPDGSFSRGVHKVEAMPALRNIYEKLFEETDLVLAQKFMPTAFDWRVGVLGGEPLFVCKYMMAKNHWQIIRHNPDGRHDEGRFETFAVEDAPSAVVDLGVRAAQPIGHGLYGIDIKETTDGLVVMEVNDNPNLEHGIEDAALKDELWLRLLRWFIARME